MLWNLLWNSYETSLNSTFLTEDGKLIGWRSYFVHKMREILALTAGWAVEHVGFYRCLNLQLFCRELLARMKTNRIRRIYTNINIEIYFYSYLDMIIRIVENVPDIDIHSIRTLFISFYSKINAHIWIGQYNFVILYFLFSQCAIITSL